MTDEDERSIQFWILAFLAYPTDQAAREVYVKALQSASDAESFDNLPHHQKRCIERASSRIIFRRCLAAQISSECMALLDDGKPLSDYIDDIKHRHISMFRAATYVRGTDSQIWDAVWSSSLTVLHFAEPIRELLQSSNFVPQAIAMLPLWGSKVAIRAELLFFDLAERPILGFDPARAWRIGPKSHIGATLTPLNGAPERELFTAPAETLAIAPAQSPFPATNTRSRDPSPQLYRRRPHYFVKPVRNDDASPDFNWQYGTVVLGSKVTPLVVPDANIIMRMLEFMQVFTEWSEFNGSGLDDIFRQLREGPTAYFAPYMAYVECGPRARKPAKKAVDTLFARFAPDIKDENQSDPDFIHSTEAPSGRTIFSNMNDFMQTLVGPAYLVFLRASLIKKSMPYLNGPSKYFALINYLSARANLIPGLEAEIAKHLFIERDGRQTASEFDAISKKIKKNFFKSASTLEKLKSERMNAARDIAYVRTVANFYASTHDQWFLTCDGGIDALFKTVYWKPTSVGVASENIYGVEMPERRATSYWREVDAVSMYFSEARKNILRENDNNKRVKDCIAETESELSRHYPLT